MKSLRWTRLGLLGCAAALILWLSGAQVFAADEEPAGKLGRFEAHGDVGELQVPSSLEVVSNSEYRITAAGKNIWANRDDFHFAWNKVSGDLTMTADIEFVGPGKVAHRKAGWMVRQSLDPGAPYADVMVHGDGLISLQYRREANGTTYGVSAPFKAPATVKLQRQGDVFTLSLARPGGDFQTVAALSVKLDDPVYAGLAACSHDAGTAETAIFKNVDLDVDVPAAESKRVRETSLETVSIETLERKLIYRARDSFEAPNWSRDGQQFYINGKNRIYTLPATGGTPQLLDIGSATGCNNDHGLSPDGKWFAISHGNAERISKISIVPSAGGSARQITPQGPSYWHGWSPDGQTLAFCGKRGEEYDIYTIPAAGGAETRLTTATGLDDGPDYSPDGGWIYFNSERSGLMQIWRMKPDGSEQQQVTSDKNFADWFPHPSPDGKWLVFLSFDKTVTGHPAAKDVQLRIMPLAGGKPAVLATLFGGQGTINVPSWSPDSKHVAFVSYRFVLP